MEGLSTMLVFFAGAVIVVLALIGLVANAGKHQRDPHRRGDDGGAGSAAAPTEAAAAAVAAAAAAGAAASGAARPISRPGRRSRRRPCARR